MEWLSIWLKKLILLVLLAAFLDLILPNTNLQRYVKMVMGLIILITIMSPLFTIFNLSQDDLALKMSRYQESLDNPADPQWKKLTNQLLSTQDGQVTGYVKQQMENLLRAQVSSQFGVAVGKVEVTIAPDENQTPVVKQIYLAVDETKDGSKGNRQAQSRIKPIEPVKIELGRTEAASVQATTDQSKPLYKQIASAVARDWQIGEAQVEVTGLAPDNEKY